jgi:hypothetical protein
MKRVIVRSALWAGLPLVLIAAAISVGQSAGTMLGEVEAQALIKKFQGPSTPLTRIESQRLLKYLIAKNTNPSAAATAVQPQAQSGGSSPRVIAPATAPVPAQAVAELKKPKLTHVGIALPKADLGPGSQGQNTGESLRLLESQYLKGPKIEVVMLTSLLESQVEAEAKEKECDYIVFSAMTQKKGGGMGFLKGASALMSVIPVAGAARGAAGAIAATATAAAAASAASSMSTQVKAKSDVTFEYHMFAVGNTTPVLENKVTAKAKEDGEDVITPLVEAAATSIVDRVLPKN